MDQGIEEFRREAEQFRRERAHHAVPWPAHLREFASRHMARRRAAGWSLGKIGRELGIADTTLWKWREGAAEPALRPVIIEVDPVQEPEPEASTELSLVSPRGYRLVGLSLRGALLLLRELG
jgi:hypothetical protein